MKIASEKEIKSLANTLKLKGYKVFERPFELNIVGLRKAETKPNTFDDKIFVFWKDKSDKWQGYINNATTDPGTYWLENPMYEQGTAFLKAGQYINAYQLGLHQGQYEALVQTGGKVNIVRGYDRSVLLPLFGGKTESGYFGINIHRASASGTTKSVDKYSAGCQVFENIGDYDTFLDLAKKHKSLYGNKFTYTLIDYRKYRRTLILRTFAGIAISGILVLGLYNYLTRKKG